MARQQFVGCAVGLSLLVCSAMGQAISYDILAVSGTPAPRLAGLTFSTFFDARTNEAGEIVFSARLAGTGVTLANERSLWVVRRGQSQLVHRQNDPAPFALDIRFDGAPFPRINAPGHLGFTSAIFDASLPPTPPQQVRLGLFTEHPSGTLIMDAENGFSIPLSPLNAAGDVAFVRTTGPTGATTLVRSVGGVPEIVLTTGESAPVPAPGWTFSYIDQPVLNAAGQMVFRASLTDGQNFTSSLWRMTGRTLEFLAWADPIPPGPGEAVFDELPLRAMLNDAGVVTFWARQRGDGFHAGNNSAYWRGTPGNIDPILRIGDPAPGIPGQVLQRLPREAASNAFGRIAFIGHLVPDSDPPMNNSVLWAETGAGGSFTPVAREGQPVPGLTGAFYAILGPVTFNHHGHVALLVNLRGAGVTNQTNLALLASDQVGRLAVVARTGDDFEIGGGVVRRIVNINFADGAMQAGTGTFAADGTVLFELRFHDKSTAIVAATVGCRADIDGNGAMDIFDFIEFGNLFDQQHPRADFEPDTVFDIFDFLAFGREFAAGCK